MTDSIPTLTETERELQKVITTGRSHTFGGKVTLFPRDSESLRYMTERAFRGGPIYSLFGGFEANQVVEWVMKILSDLTENSVDFTEDHTTLPWGTGWAEAKAEINRLIEAKLAEDTANLQNDYDGGETHGAFREWNRTALVDDGLITDPWGCNYIAICRWFLNNMTQFIVFTVYQTVREAVIDSVDENLLVWAEGVKGSDPRPVAEKAFSDATANLGDFIEATLKG